MRAARGTAIAVFATFVASLAHTLGGGTPPGPVSLLVALAFSAPLAMLLTGAHARLVRTAAAALVAQGALHLTYAMGGAAPMAAGAGSTHVGHGGHTDPTAQLAALPSSASLDNGHEWMPFAHLIAAAITVAALALGDRVFDALGRLVRVFVRRLTTIPAPIVASTIRIPPDAPRRRLVGALLHAALGSRGPPVVSAAL